MNIDTLADLLLFLSVIGLIAGLSKPRLFHKYAGTQHPRKVTGIFFGSLLIISLVILATHTPKTPADTKTSSSSSTSIIKDAVTKDLAGTSDLNDKKFRSVDVIPQSGGGYGVFVSYNADEVGSDDSQQTIFTEDATQLYKTIYNQTHQDVRTASVSAYFAGTDKYGNKSDKLVYKTILDKNVAGKINWSADSATLETKLPSLWNVTVKDF